jgi:uncharacterized protein
MVLEGVVTNVAAFGAFVDVGVHQDGLVHVSAMSRSFVSDPRALAKPGDVVKVKVLGVDKARKRISLTMRLDDEPDGSGSEGGMGRRVGRQGPGSARDRRADQGRDPRGQKPQGQKPQGRDPQGQKPQGRDPEGQKPRGQDREGQKPRDRDREGQKPRDRDRRGGGREDQAPGPDGAMADALRRAGLA